MVCLQTHLLISHLNLFPHEIAASIDAEEDEEQQCEAPKRRSTVAEEGQGNADDGCKSQHHAHIDKYME